MVTLLMVWIYWLIIVLKSTCECVLWINGIELKWFLVWIVETELDELWCLLTWITWTIVNAYWSIGPLQSLVLKEHWWLLDIQYTPQGIDESLSGLSLYTLNSWLWQLKTHGHNATMTPRYEFKRIKKGGKVQEIQSPGGHKMKFKPSHKIKDSQNTPIKSPNIACDSTALDTGIPKSDSSKMVLEVQDTKQNYKTKTLKMFNGVCHKCL